MRIPQSLIGLADQGVIDEVVRPLMSGKEAQVYLVIASGERRVAKVYKEADHRSFKHRADYVEGRRVRNSRSQRAMAKRSRFGRGEIEAAWRNAEVDIIHQLHAAGVRVPVPYDFVDGVLVMELVQGADGEPAPRLVDVNLHPDEARDLFHRLLREVVRMLCVGVVHGDLSDFNVLLTPDEPVIIDFPQAVDPAHNRNARRLLIRDVDNLSQFLGRFVPDLKKRKYGQEMWSLYERGKLEPDTQLTGRFRPSNKPVNTMSLLEEIEAVEREARQRREALGLPVRPARQPVTRGPRPKPIQEGSRDPNKKSSRKNRNKRGRNRRNTDTAPPPAANVGPEMDRPNDAPPKRRRRRRRRKKPAENNASTSDPLDSLLIIED